jgi:hypothetical protein
LKIDIDEPVKVWNGIRDRYGKDIITRYYEDQPKYAFQFQMMAYITRLNELRKASKMYKLMENVLLLRKEALKQIGKSSQRCYMKTVLWTIYLIIFI